jgi:hypothetical protein
MTDETNENTPATTEETNGDTQAPTRWTKGMASPNPLGRPKMPKTAKEVKELAKEHTPLALKTLAAVCGNPKAPPAARVAASEALLSRAWGKPSGDFEGLGEGLTIQIVKFNNPQIGDDMKLIEGEVERSDDENE